MKRTRRRAAALASLAAFAVAPSASAQGIGPTLPGPAPIPLPGPGTQPTVPDQRIEETTLGDSGNVRARESSKSVRLFDSTRSIFSYQLDIGPLWNRRVTDTTPKTERTNFKHGAPLAGEIGVGTLYTSPAGPFFLVGHQKTVFRVLDDKSFSWSLFHQEFGGGVALGPLEPEVRLRLGIFNVDIMHAQPSAQLLSPGVSAALGLRFGKLRIDARGNADYLWRWFGPDYMVRSFTVGIRLDAQVKKPFERTLQTQ